MAKKLIKGVNDFKTVCPEIAAEWAYDLNGDLTPDQFFPGSDVKAYWRCKKCGSEWQAWVRDRKSGSSQCPVCKKNSKVIPNNLMDKAPLLAEEWDSELNADLTPDMVAAGSHDYAWWKCRTCGNSYKARIGNRFYGDTGCPNCNKERRTSFPEQAILFYMKQLPCGAIGRFTSNWFTKGKKCASPEIDIYLPTLGVGIEYDGQMFHSDLEKDLEKSNLCDDLGITLYRVREAGCPDIPSVDNDLIQMVKARNDCDLEKAIRNIAHSIEKIYGMICDIDVNLARDKQKIYGMMDCSVKEASFADAYPGFAKFWDYQNNGSLTPDKVSAKSNKEVYWICETCGESFKTPVHRRANSKWCKCTHCAHKEGSLLRWRIQKNLEVASNAS